MDFLRSSLLTVGIGEDGAGKEPRLVIVCGGLGEDDGEGLYTSDFRDGGFSSSCISSVIHLSDVRRGVTIATDDLSLRGVHASGSVA